MEKWNELRCDFENKKNRSRYNFQKSIRSKWFCLSDPNNIYEFWNSRYAYMMVVWCGVRSIRRQIEDERQPCRQPSDPTAGSRVWFARHGVGWTGILGLRQMWRACWEDGVIWRRISSPDLWVYYFMSLLLATLRVPWDHDFVHPWVGR